MSQIHNTHTTTVLGESGLKSLPEESPVRTALSKIIRYLLTNGSTLFRSSRGLDQA